MEPGAEILPAYDSLIAKLVARGRTREEAIARMTRALGEFKIEGVPSTIPFHLRVMANDEFARNGATTAFLVEHPEVVPESSFETEVTTAEAPKSWRELLVEVNGRQLAVRMNGDPLAASSSRQSAAVRRPVHRERRTAKASSETLLSPIQGTVLRIAVTAGNHVDEGDLICVIEAMKMENEIRAQRTGSIAELPIAQGGTVRIGDVVAVIR
jgi:acetyl-CoA/propionyl-CoA carboxylase biotin carboxyl carrier protein